MLFDPAILIHFDTISWGEAALRVFLACVFGFVIGYDRNMKNKPIDFRVYMIVAAISCMLTLMAQELHHTYQDASQMLNLDLGKVIEGVLVGIGFLGAGTIIHQGNRVVGTATGASIWASGAVGLMVGFGFYSLATMAFFTMVFILICMGKLRKPLFDEPEVCKPAPENG